MSYRARYTIERSLGTALYGDVWLCKDTKHQNRLVAVKQVSLHEARTALETFPQMDNPSVERLVVSALTQLERHPNVLQFYHEFEQDEYWFLVMEYCENGDLMSTLQSVQDNRLPTSTTKLLFRQIASGVQYLHSYRLAHRDLSLENIFLQGKTCKIADFGLCVNAERMCQGRVGKSYTMAPEVVAEKYYDPRAADMWSLGVILFAMLTGSQLTPMASEEDVSFNYIKDGGVGKLLKLWNMLSLVDDDLVDLLDQLLQIDPSKRLTIYDTLQHRALQIRMN